MRLYHGTTAKLISAIIEQGITPRLGREGNFAHTVESCPHAVYLTDAYPLYFAANAVGKDDRGLVIEIDTDRLIEAKFNADEDVLEQLGRKGRDGLPLDWSMERRVQHYRDQLLHETWDFRDSLSVMGTCCYLGTIPVEAITRVAVIDFSRQKILRYAAMDAQISVMNYRFCAHDYRTMTRWVFGDPEEEIETDTIDPSQILAMLDREFGKVPPYTRNGRDGIEIIENFGLLGDLKNNLDRAIS